MMDELNHPNIGAMIDTIPMALAGEHPEDYLKTFGERLVHVHFIDGAPRGHLAWGDGCLDMKDYWRSFRVIHITAFCHWRLQMEDIGWNQQPLYYKASRGYMTY